MQHTNSLTSVERRLPVGAELLPGGGVHFRVWAPKRRRVVVVLESAPNGEVELEPEGENGYFSAVAEHAAAGTLYRFRLDDEKLYPDPASRFQPQGVHGPSEVIDHAAFEWGDGAWRGIGPANQVLYELHVGTFTKEGTWAAAIEKLPFLKDIGVTCIEMMPVADWAGEYNWGYDGVDLFAPTRCYGRPDDLRRFIDAAHAIGLAVILDVVYNHLGPDGNYVNAFTDTFFDKSRHTDWGDPINFGGDGSAGVRELYLANARYWIEEFHFDGYRFDATQMIFDDSDEHILAAVTRVAREAAGERGIYLVAENETQHTAVVRPRDRGGVGMDALWNDDFHHSAMVAVTGRNEAYFTDYRGTAQEFVSACKWGYLYQGQIYRWQQKRRGSPGLDLLPIRFVNYIQNHDQIANFGIGLRAHQLGCPNALRAMTAMLLLAPQTPLLFQGQEWAASAPFNFFADHHEELGKLICSGRRREVAQFPSAKDPRLLDLMPTPCGSRATFDNCKIDWSEIDRPPHEHWLALHRDLLRLRRDEACFRRVQYRGDIDGAVLGDHNDAFVLRFFGKDGDDRLLVVNLGVDLELSIVPEPLLAAPHAMRWEIMWSSESPIYGGGGVAPLENQGEEWRLPGENWRIPGRTATVLRPVPTKVQTTQGQV